MKIDRVKLTNYGPHENLDIKVDSDFVGIVGDNGSGKSSLVMAISDAVTGDFHKKKSKILTYGKKTGSIGIEGRVNGQSIQLIRAINGSEATMIYGEEEISGAEKVNQKIVEVLGCDQSFLSNMVFVKQTDILGLLFGRPAERNKLLQRFFGLERASKIETGIGQWISNLTYPAIIDENLARESITDIEKSLVQHEERYEELEKQIETYREEQLSEAELKKIQENLDRATKVETARKEELEKDQKLTQLEMRLDSKQRQAPEFTMEEMDKERDKLYYDIEAVSACRKMVTMLKEAIELSSHSDCAGCPLCQTKLTKAKLDRFSIQLTSESDTLAKLESGVKISRQALAEMEHEMSGYNREIGEIQTEIRTVKRDIALIEQTLSGPIPKHPSDTYRDAISRGSELTLLIAAARREMSQVSATILSLEQQKSRHEDAIKKSQDVKKIHDGTKLHATKIARIRGVFRHNGKSTEQFIHAKMKKMQESINQYLACFDAPYRVRVQSDNELSCVFANKAMDAEELSCGQKVALSLAFRFASCELFVSGVNAIFLDEPTTWLDRKRIENFPAVLDVLREISTEKGLQVFTVTHERSLIPHFNQVIEF